MTNQSLIQFPCHFPVKIIGANSPLFFEEIKIIALTHFPALEESAITQKPSEKNNFLAITVTVYAENQEMLDEFYKALTQHPEIKMVL